MASVNGHLIFNGKQRMSIRKRIAGHQIELITFDWDGTLMDSTGAIVASLQAACRDLGIAEPSEQRALHIIGLGLRDALVSAVPDLPEDRYAALAERYRYRFFSHEGLVLFPGVTALIDELEAAGYHLAVATGKTRRGLDRALQESGMVGRFHATRCADECHSKPHPQMLHELMDEFAVAPEATLMIGDTTHDLLMAKNAGANALAVTYGAHPRGALEAELPVFCASSVEELTVWLRTS